MTQHKPLSGILSVLALLVGLALPAAAQHSVTLTWTASVVDATHDAPTNYNILRGTTTGGPYTNVGATSANQLSFVDLSSATNVLTPGAKLFYVITAQNNTATSPPSNEVSVVIPSFPPGAPTTLSATAK